jgi:hypothetical protein
MSSEQPFAIVYAPIVGEHLRAIERKYFSLIRTTIERQLSFEPDRETRNRKPLTRAVPFEANWEIRFGANNRFRVFYTVDTVKREVSVQAIGEKKGNRLWIGGEEVDI